MNHRRPPRSPQRSAAPAARSCGSPPPSASFCETSRGLPRRSVALAARSRAFTLVELLVSLGVLAILIVVIAQMFNGATLTTTGSRKRLDADGIARAVFDRMGSDFEHMVKRPDVNYDFVITSTSSLTGSNDSMYFYAESAGYPGASASQASTAALVGYRINNQFQMERLGERLAWTGTGSPPTGCMAYLTYSQGGPAPDATSIISGANSSSPFYPVISSTTSSSSSYYYDVLGDSVFRLEIGFQLSDGTLSTLPVTNPSSTTNNLAGTGPPTGTGFTSGSRWYDTAGQRGYICTSAPAGGTPVWAPIGVRDISAVIVAIAILDNTSRAVVTSSPGFSQLAGVFPDANLTGTNPQLMAAAWQNVVASTTFAQQAGIPPTAASQVRIYQRYFYLNNH